MAYDTMDPWSAVARRREMASMQAPRSSWDWNPQDATYGAASTPESAGGSLASTGDPLLDTIRNTTMADAAARTRAARGAAVSRAPNDASLAAFADLAALIGGQGDASRALNEGASQRLQQIDARKWQEYILRLKRQWEEQDMRNYANAMFWNNIGDKAGNVGEAALSKWLGL